MKKLIAVLVAGLFTAGAFAATPAEATVVPAASVHHVAQSKHHVTKKHKKVVRHHRQHQEARHKAARRV